MENLDTELTGNVLEVRSTSRKKKSMLFYALMFLTFFVGCGDTSSEEDVPQVKVYMSFWGDSDRELAQEGIASLGLPAFKVLEDNYVDLVFEFNSVIEGKVLKKIFTQPDQLSIMEVLDIDLIYFVLPEKYKKYVEPISSDGVFDSQTGVIANQMLAKEIEAVLDSIIKVGGELPFDYHFEELDNHSEVYLHLISKEDGIHLGDGIVSLTIQHSLNGLPSLQMSFDDEAAEKVEIFSSKNLGFYVATRINDKVCSVPMVNGEILYGTIEFTGEEVVENLLDGVFYDEGVVLKSIEIILKEKE